jgi:general secretion pathway protein I
MYTSKTAIKKMSVKSTCKGFTLLEVMISVSILAIVFLSLFNMQSGTIELATTGRFNTLAPMLARQLLADIEQDPSEWSEFEGHFGSAYPGIIWQCDISVISESGLDFISDETWKRLHKIKIKIIDSSEEISFDMETIRFSDE